MATQIVSSGATLSGAAIGVGNVLLVDGGGTAIVPTISGGTETVFGVTSDTLLTQSGFQGISSGGIAEATSVTQGAVQTVLSSGTAVDTTIDQGGYQVVSYGGLAERETIGAGGFQVVSNGGLALDVSVTSGGIDLIDGSVKDLTVDSGGWAIVSSGGSLSGVTVGSGGVLFALVSGTVSDATVDNGGYLIDLPGASVTAQGGGSVVSSGVAVVHSGSSVELYTSSAPDLNVTSGSLEFVLSGGVAVSGTVAAGANQAVYAGGFAKDVTLSHSFQVLSSGGSATRTTVDDGSVQYVFSGASATSTTVNSGFAIIDAGGSATHVVVNSGGNESLDGTVTDTVLNSGGGQYVDVGGVAIHTAINNGAYAYVSGTTSGATIGSGGFMVLSRGGAAISTAIDNGGTLIAQFSATTSETSVGAGGIAVVMSGAVDYDAQVASGGTFVELAGAAVVNPTFAAGANVVSGGVVTLSGGSAVMLPGMSVSGNAVGGHEHSYVFSGGSETATTITSGGVNEIDAGGMADDTTIQSAGELLVSAGAAISGAITFAGDYATLITHQDTLPNAVISGFANTDTIYLPHLSGTTPSVNLLPGNTLTVTDGSQTASFQLDPGQDFSGEQFVASLGQDGGVDITLAATTSASTPPAGSDPQPVDIPLYIIPYDAQGYKVGIQVSLDGGATYKMDEFDTGANGFFAAYSPAWWSSYTTQAANPIFESYGAGNSYLAQVVSTNVTLQTQQGEPLTINNVNVGLITESQKDTEGGWTPQGWNAHLTSTPSTAPLDGPFYGDFGMDLVNGEIGAVLAQLPGGLSNGFIIRLGSYPNGSTGQIGELQIGLTQADIASYSTLIPMQGQNTLNAFSTSGEPSYSQQLASGMLQLSNSSGTFSVPTGFIFDTGAPGMDIHEGSNLTSSDLAPYVNDGQVTSGTDVQLSATAAAGGDSGWDLSFPAGNDVGSNYAGVSSGSSSPAYVNAAVNSFFGESVMFDLADGLLGFQTISCFVSGTRIATPDGEVAVEALRIGDHVLTAGGASQPIIWVGHRSIDCRRHASPNAIQPVRVAAHAFGPNLPRRDLLLSPDHALLIDGNLIPVKYLVNGSSVARLSLLSVTYYHVELSRHDVILAEGLPAETYLETGHRSAFANGGAIIQAHPDFAPREAEAQLLWEAKGCAPLVVAGPALEKARRKLRRDVLVRPAVFQQVVEAVQPAR